jgi:GNAT superfamily N-acetyltransferase
MPHELEHEGYLISDDPARIDVDAVHAYLSRSYWAEGIPRQVVAQSLANSLAIGIYAASGSAAEGSATPREQVGLVRVISDYTTFAYLCDVYVLEPHRGRGLSKAAMNAVMTHPRLQGLRRMQLVTQDAHGLYERYGFNIVAQPERHMERRDPDAYKNNRGRVSGASGKL